ncbi:MAG: hypothetical protein RLO06_18510 [Parvibaculum sp.]|jgi:hypothetical protein
MRYWGYAAAALYLAASSAHAQTVNPFGARAQPAATAVPVTPQPIGMPLPPLSYFAVVGDVALLTDGQRVIRAANGQKVTIAGATYKAVLKNDELVLTDSRDDPVFYASLGYGVFSDKASSE